MIRPFSFSRYCSTKDKTVNLTVNYIFAGCYDDTNKTPYIKGTLDSCSACNGFACNTCEVLNKLDDEIYI